MCDEKRKQKVVIGSVFSFVPGRERLERGESVKVIEAPNEWQGHGLKPSLFLAGGITDCPDWQQELIAMLEDIDVAAFNPRRKNFPIHDPSAAHAQIEWEHRHLRKADYILFWFPCETLCPIVLYELGAWSMTQKPIIVGVHPDYKRRRDVEIQTKLARPGVPVVSSLGELAAAVKRLGW